MRIYRRTFIYKNMEHKQLLKHAKGSFFVAYLFIYLFCIGSFIKRFLSANLKIVEQSIDMIWTNFFLN